MGATAATWTSLWSCKYTFVKRSCSTPPRMFGFVVDRRSNEESNNARHADLAVAAALRLTDGCNHSRQMTLDPWPTCRQQDNDGHAAASEILLVLEVLVRGDKDLEPCFFSRGNEFPILKLRPALFVRGCHFMTCQRVAQWRRGALIEKNLHSDGFEGAASGVHENGSRLLHGDARKPFDKVVYRCIVFKILEQRRDRHARATKHPSAADTGRVSLDNRAGGPVNHVRMLSAGPTWTSGNQRGAPAIRPPASAAVRRRAGVRGPARPACPESPASARASARAR